MSGATLSPSSNSSLPVRRRDSGRTGWAIFLVSLALLSLIAALSLILGAKAIPFATVVDSLSGDASGPDATIILESRLPRTLLGLLAGAALGASGALIQALTRNPLAEPGILGVNAGAGLAMVLGVAFFGVHSQVGYLGLASLGALLTTVLVFFAGYYGATRMDPLRFVLAGVAIGAVMAGAASAVTLLHPSVFDTMRYWSAGSLNVRSLEPVLWVAPVIVAGILLALFLATPLNAIAMGEDLAVALGAKPQWVQGLSILAITLLCGGATAATGPIAFVGLMIPHIARWLMGADQRWIILLTLTLSPCLLLSADILGRFLAPGELRVSIVTAFLGAPILIWLARRHQGGA
ncbi:Fe(3+)-siderophore ABC transporter permease [Hahella aquimaris]|uniref:Fe(3+)-siderophore ABC transporter permease n=1 Tax=Hahella sp. HNIBRBA332 TaxID=3015983 RepID=UPI00273B89C6|nr:Fe(3+)-siderophore ABC transporter permease [Hahella sp. HNIBRBA332]WLQ15973.1 Fe(3+)-siderophore ABC transporter permease [Hahella sp. HNIBRBA332]